MRSQRAEQLLSAVEDNDICPQVDDDYICMRTQAVCKASKCSKCSKIHVDI